jgi:alanyl-tRNA synthetase
MKTSNEIRQEFIDFFVTKYGHAHVPSSALLPAEDPTLLFANAGMNQFKSIFLGTETRDYVRAANTQKCIRAGGKHNDLEDVGHDCYHHTYFEMLGNWSFGDYFKAEAIEWAWELLTGVWGLPKDRLYATVFGGDAGDGLDADSEAEAIWREKTDIDPSHILHGDKKDNFWEMGETGPCGPCSEIHIDLTPDKSGKDLVNAGDPRAIEIWNLVFIQYNRDESGTLSPLPAKHVDTGMGFERVTAVMQGKNSNYATDIFRPLLTAIEARSGHVYGGTSGLGDRYDVPSEEDSGDVACRVIADHARAMTFAITDGIMPSNEGRGYVLRRILRRAARYGRQNLGIEGLFISDLVDVVVDQMAGAFPELVGRRDFVKDVIREEEESFGRTLDRGIDLFNKQADKLVAAGESVLPGEMVFELYATYGFPADLTALMAAERGMTVDQAGFDRAMGEHKALSQAGAGSSFKAADIPDLPETDDSAKFSNAPVDATVLGWVLDGQFVTDGSLAEGSQAPVVLDVTNFYAEQGGQVGDAGQLIFEGGCFHVEDAQLAGRAVLHVGTVQSGALSAGQKVSCVLDPDRRAIMRNHTATHLLNWALRKVLGDHINQAGSVVAADRLRFDFSHGQAVSAEDLALAERLVNEAILADCEITDRMMPLSDAQKIPGVRAMFGEKYPDPVRVVTIGGDPERGDFDGATFPAEFCGGTHMERTGGIGMFKILSEESVAKGVRRITAVTGMGAVDAVQDAEATLSAITGLLKTAPAKLPERVAAMQKEIKELKKGSKIAPKSGSADDASIVETLETSVGLVLIAKAFANDVGAMRTFCDVQRNKGAAAVFIGAADEKKVTLIAMVSDDVVATGKLKAGDWVKQIAPVVGGKGGGKPTLAQAGGQEPGKLDDALTEASKLAAESLS